ncbi:SLAP domain-containing protein [Companilactobacillus nodensis]|nr:SLAP domain-containing protein [Companilactobacillus nodensis]
MKKKRVIIVSTLLSAGIITAAVVVDNTSLFSNLNVIENVKADDKDENDINSWMPDENLQQIIADIYKVDIEDLTWKILEEKPAHNKGESLFVHLEGVEDLDGLQYVKKMTGVRFYNPVKNINVLSEHDYLNNLQIANVKTANFDPYLFDLKYDSSRKPGTSRSGQIFTGEMIKSSKDFISIDLKKYFGDTFIGILNDEVNVITENPNATSYFDKINKIVEVSNLTREMESEDGSYTGNIKIEFVEIAHLFSVEMEPSTVTIQITIPYEITPKPKPGGGGGKPTNKIESIDTTNIMTDKKAIDTYDAYGQNKKERTLTKQTTDFVTETKNTVGKTEYYRIGENEWVKTDDVKVFHFNNAVKQTHGDDHKELTQFRNRGKVENRALKSSSSWVTDRYAYFKDDKYHRVATHEWVHDDHVLKYTPIDGVLKVNENVPLYNSQGKVRNRGLMNNSEFITDRTATINDQLMYRVATDEWVPASSVTLK